MRIAPSLAACLLVVVCDAGAQAATSASPMQPGLWETTLVTESPTSTAKRSVVSRTCHSPADIADRARVVPRQREPGMTCQNREVKGQGTAVQWRIACTSAEETLGGSGEMTLTANAYTGRAELDRKKRGAKPERLSQSISGKWLGACK